MHIYHDVNKTLPPAVHSKDGKPLLSWRVLVLPYIEEDKLYREFHLDEPWDSPHNKKLLSRMPAVLRSPLSNIADQGRTVYLTPRIRHSRARRGSACAKSRMALPIRS